MNRHKPTSEDGAPKLAGGADSHQDEHFLFLYNAAYPRIYAYVFTLLPDRNDAYDVVQETSLVLLRRFNDFRCDSTQETQEIEGFVRWGCGIALNQVRRLRRERTHALQFSEEVLDRLSTAREKHSTLLESRRQHLPECLERLSEADRELAFRCSSQTASLKVIAEQLNRPVNTLYKAMSRIRVSLKECIDLAVRREERP